MIAAEKDTLTARLKALAETWERDGAAWASQPGIQAQSLASARKEMARSLRLLIVDEALGIVPVVECAYCHRMVSDFIRPVDPGCLSGTVRCPDCGAYSSVLLDEPSRSVVVSAGVYFIGCGNFIKIGKTDYFPNRWATLQAYSPLDFEPLGFIPFLTALGDAGRCERALHARFWEFRLRGEWFHRHPVLVEWIQRNALKPAPFLSSPGLVR